MKLRLTTWNKLKLIRVAKKKQIYVNFRLQ